MTFYPADLVKKPSFASFRKVVPNLSVWEFWLKKDMNQDINFYRALTYQWKVWYELPVCRIKSFNWWKKRDTVFEFQSQSRDNADREKDNKNNIVHIPLELKLHALSNTKKMALFSCLLDWNRSEKYLLWLVLRSCIRKLCIRRAYSCLFVGLSLKILM